MWFKEKSIDILPVKRVNFRALGIINQILKVYKRGQFGLGAEWVKAPK
jgi:hypothetical protein